MKQRNPYKVRPVTFGGGVRCSSDKVVVADKEGRVLSIQSAPKGVKEVVNDYCKEPQRAR